MHVLIICKYDKDWIKSNLENQILRFPIISISGYFRRSSAANSVVGGPIWLGFELIQGFMHIHITNPTIGLSFRPLVSFCIFLLVVTKLERLMLGSEAADDL